MAERMTKGIDTSNLPKLDELLQAYQNNGPADAVNSLAQGVSSGIDLSHKIAQRKEQHDAAVVSLQKEIQKAKEEAVKGKAREDLTKHIAPITAATPASSQVPVTLGQVANVNPEVTSTPAPGPYAPDQAPMEDNNQVLQAGPQIAAQDEAKRRSMVKADLFNAAPEQTSGKIADSILGTSVKPQIAVKPDGSFRTVTADENGRYALEPGETLKDIASQRERAKPQYERNDIMRQGLAQRYQFKSADLAAKYGASTTMGSLKGNDQLAAKAYDNTGRGLTLVSQLEAQGGTTPQQLAELTGATLRAVTGQTVVPQGTFNHYMPDTLKQRYGDFNSFIKSEPTQIEMDEFVKYMKDTLERERAFNQGIVESALARQSAGHAEALKAINPDLYNTVNETVDQGKNDVGDEVLKNRGKKPTKLSAGKPPLDSFFK